MQHSGQALAIRVSTIFDGKQPEPFLNIGFGRVNYNACLFFLCLFFLIEIATSDFCRARPLLSSGFDRRFP
jgi:hypothetical protein